MSETCELILVDDGSRDRTYEKDVVNFIAIKKHKAVTLSPLLPYVYDSLLLIYGRPGSFTPDTYHLQTWMGVMKL